MAEWAYGTVLRRPKHLRELPTSKTLRLMFVRWDTSVPIWGQRFKAVVVACPEDDEGFLSAPQTYVSTYWEPCDD